MNLTLNLKLKQKIKSQNNLLSKIYNDYNETIEYMILYNMSPRVNY